MKKLMNAVLALSMLITVANVSPVWAEDGEETVIEETEEVEIATEETVEETVEEPVTIEEEPVKEEKVELAKEPVEPGVPVFASAKVEVVLGDTPADNKLTLTDNEYTLDTLTYGSDNTAVATVDNQGKVTVVKDGTATIKATAKYYALVTDDNGLNPGDAGYTETKKEVTKEASYTLTVTKPAPVPTPVIKFAKNTVTYYINKTFTYPVTLSDAACGTLIGAYKITYTSSNKNVVTVNSDGSFTTKGYGTAVITANAVKYDNNAIKAAPVKLTVNVPLAPVKLTCTSNTKKYFKINWGRSDATKYEIQYSRTADFKSKKSKTYNSETFSKKIKKPSKNKNYYVRVRAVKKVGSKTLYSEWTTVNTSSADKKVDVNAVSANLDKWARKLTSSTNYLIIVDATNCYTGVYQKVNGTFVQKFLWRNTPGKEETPTKPGTYKVRHKKLFFISGIDRAWYATGITGHRYLHSILYYASEAKKWKVKDNRLGKHLSHGCIRHATENAYWMYKNIPLGTTVKIIAPAQMLS